MKFKKIINIYKRFTHKRDIKQKIADDVFKYEVPIQSILLSRNKHNVNRPSKIKRLKTLKEHVIKARDKRLLEIKDLELRKYAEKEYDQLIRKILEIQAQIVFLERKKKSD
jgi:hypothetical protein